jgi:hypothetical protein
MHSRFRRSPISSHKFAFEIITICFYPHCIGIINILSSEWVETQFAKSLFNQFKVLPTEGLDRMFQFIVFVENPIQ